MDFDILTKKADQSLKFILLSWKNSKMHLIIFTLSESPVAEEKRHFNGEIMTSKDNCQSYGRNFEASTTWLFFSLCNSGCQVTNN